MYRLLRREFLVVACVCGAFAWTAGAAVAAPTWLEPVDLSGADQYAQGQHVAVDAGGDAVVVWELSVGQSSAVKAAVRPAGGSFSEPADLKASQDTTDPSVAMDAAGDAVAVWDDYDGTTYTAEAATRPAGGSFSTAADPSGPTQYKTVPQVSMDAAGDATAVWDNYDGANSTAQAATRPAGGSFSNFATISKLLQPRPGRFVFSRLRAIAAGAATLHLRVVANAHGKRLMRHHRRRVTIRLWVTFTPTGGTPRSVGFYGLHLTRRR